MKQAMVIRDLRKSYGSVAAIDGVSFEIPEGEVFGMVGPNGAGKTTTIECIEGLRQPDNGTVRVLDLDPWRNGYELRQKIGVQLQESALHPRLKVWEAMDLFSSFYDRTVDAGSLLEQLGLETRRKAYVAKLSGGQKQRLHIALALINDPDLVFLDELTTGLDPQARRAMWDLVRSMREQGKTVFLTTHYMEEAEELCDRVAILDGGKIIALDTPGNLIRSLNAENRLVFSLDGEFDPAPVEALDSVSRVERSGERVVVHGRGHRLVSSVVIVLEDQRVRFRDLRTEQPSLEDVFLALTGRAVRA